MDSQLTYKLFFPSNMKGELYEGKGCREQNSERTDNSGEAGSGETVLPFDPFGLDRMMYTVKNQCVEVPGMEYEDGASTLFLYTRGTEGVPSEALRQLLHYMEDTVYGNAVNEELREIHRMVEVVKNDPEVAGMRIQLVDDVIRLSEENEKLTEEKEKISEEKEKISREKDKISEESAKKTEQITKLTEEAEKMAEEIKMLREELGQK